MVNTAIEECHFQRSDEWAPRLSTLNAAVASDYSSASIEPVPCTQTYCPSHSHAPPFSPSQLHLDRAQLTSRNYADNKIEENITAEIMMTCLTETRESYDENIVVELKSDGSGGDNEVEDNVGRIEGWIQQWTKDREEGVH